MIELMWESVWITLTAILASWKFVPEMACQGRITRCNSAGIVRYQSQEHAVIANVDVWMVSGGLCDGGNTVYKCHCSHEILEAPLSLKLTFMHPPLRVSFREVTNFGWGQRILHRHHLAQ